MKIGLIPQFTQKDVDLDIKQFLTVEKPKLEKSLIAIGLEFVKEARTKTKIENPKPLTYPHEKSGFYDLTANLRSSIGFVVENNSTQVKKDFTGEAEGTNKGLDSALKISAKYTGLKLIVVAGMEYAVYVEAKGYDVITNSIPLASEVKRKIKLFTGLE